MAKILTSRFVPRTFPFENYGCVSYNNHIYINTQNTIYEYDPLNDILSLKVTKTNTTDIDCFIYDSYIYTFRKDYICRYDIGSGAYSEYYKSISGFPAGGSYWKRHCYFLMGNTIVLMSLGSEWSYGQAKYVVYKSAFKFDMTTETLSTVEPTYGSNNVIPSKSQLLSADFFGGYIGSTPYGNETNYFGYIYGTALYSNNRGTWKNPKGFSQFIYEGKHYIIGGSSNSRNISYYDDVSNTVIDLNVDIPFNVIDKWCANIEDKFYILDSTGILILEFVEYNLTYDIYDNSGSIKYTEKTNNSPISSVRFNFSGEGYVGFVFNTLSGSVSGSYMPQVPQGYRLVGFSSSKDTKIVLYKLNEDIPVIISEDFSFYEVYEIYRPPTTTFEMNLYKNAAEDNRVDKTDALTSVGIARGVLRDSTSITDLVVTFESIEVPTFNYVYIPVFGRYYYVNDITSLNYKLWEISLSVDVLMTYKDAILECKAFIDRNEGEYNPNVVDKKRVVEEGQDIETNFVTNDLFTTTAGSFVLNGFLAGIE